MQRVIRWSYKSKSGVSTRVHDKTIPQFHLNKKS